jgi:hypothetical protein
MSTPREWPTMDDFYLDDARRWGSPESDYGVHWRDGDRAWPEWRVSYIRDTGEIYATRQGGRGSLVRLLGAVPADPVADGEVYYRTLDAILDGWADPGVSGFSLAWVTSRLAATRPDAEERVRDILRAAGHPELAQEGTGPDWHVVTPGWHVFTYAGAVRVDWWSEGTLSTDPAAWQADAGHLAALRPALEAAGLTVTTPDHSVLEIGRQES